MAITLRQVKGSPLTHDELDANFTTLQGLALDHTSISVLTPTNSGLSGGGTIAANRSLSIDITNLPAWDQERADTDLVIIYDVSGETLYKATWSDLWNSLVYYNSHVADNIVAFDSGAGVITDSGLPAPSAGTWTLTGTTLNADRLNASTSMALNSEDVATEGAGTTGGTGSAGAGNQYVELRIGGTRYKVLHDGTI